MPLFREQKVLFIHIPKTAGMSITETLNQSFGLPEYDDVNYEKIAEQHYLLRDLEEKEALDDYFIFSIVRNPWDRMVSEFEWRKRFNLEGGRSSFKSFLQ